MATAAYVLPNLEIDAEFATEVRAGLSKAQKELPSRYFYDQVGSALFDTITVLPEYGLTRAEERILRRHFSGVMRIAGLSLSESLLRSRAGLMPGSGCGLLTRYASGAVSAAGTSTADAAASALPC